MNLLQFFKLVSLLESEVKRDIERAANAQTKEKHRRQLEIAKSRRYNMPDRLGTVDEISKRYGISKSEVRRRKADGTLHELAVQQPTQGDVVS